MWVRIDDGMHNHRKTRAVTKSHPTKTRDAAPIGIWTLAASWAGQNGTDGWVPEDELDRWDSEWKPLVARLVSSGYWWPHQRDGEPGFGFNDWHDYNDPAGAASKAGTYGNHVRWHVNEAKVDPTCDHCPKEPDEPEIPEFIGGRSGGDSHPISGGESGGTSGAIALPEPDPNPNPTRTQETLLLDTSSETDRFDEFWDAYDKKRGRKKAEQKWRLALRKRGVTADLLIAAARSYVEWQKSEGKHPEFTKDPATWLNGEHWTDERVARAQPVSRTQGWLQLAADLGDQPAPHSNIRQIGPRP